MIILFYISCMIFSISNIFMLLTMFISKKSYYDREKSSPFECGFDPKSSSRIPFSLRFFLITIIFLIFDVEIVLIFPVIPIMNLINYKNMIMTMMFFILILLIGLFHEWNQGALDWTN
nr:NADH dehydrogenase subunit 3 [Pseudolycoriella hygida]